MYDSQKLKLAAGDPEAARPDDHPGLITYAGERPLDWATRNVHPISLAALALRASGGSLVAGLWRRWVKDVVKPYRPELHYMRGPGPKWHEKHDLH